MDRVLITGGTGFIGKVLALSLKRKGYDVATISTLSETDSRRAEELEKAGIETTECDIFSDKLSSVVAKCAPNVLVHAAGAVGLVAANGRTPGTAEYTRVNVDGTLRVLKAAKESGVGQFIYPSSASVYGKSVYLPIDEKHPTNPVSPYGVSKLEAEKRANAFRTQEMKVFIPRAFNVYGPNPTRPEFVSKTIESVEKNEQPVLNGEGKPTRDFIYISDFADAVETGIRKRLGITLNVGTGRETSLLELAEMVISMMGSNLRPKLMPERAGDVDRSVADVSNATRAGIVAKISLEKGLKLMIEH